MILKTFSFLFFLSVLTLHSNAGLAYQQNGNWLESGLEAERNGEYEKALEIWSDSKSEFGVQSLDISRNFLRVATEHRLKSHYEEASAMYYWALNSQQWSLDEELLEKEIEAISLLADDRRAKALQTDLKNKNPELYGKIISFWKYMDPTPDTPLNERLIEHWERIHFARENYNRSNLSPFGTDPRGITYVRYGKPDQRITGDLIFSRHEFEAIARQLQEGLAEIQRFSLVEAALMIHTDTNYEVWMYDKKNPAMQYDLIQLFVGNRMESYDTLEDIIPDYAFSMQQNRFQQINFNNNNKTQGATINPGMMLQMLYYQQFSSANAFFADAYTQMEMNYIGGTLTTRPTSTVDGSMNRQKNIHQQKELISLAPEEESTYMNSFEDLDINGYQYRILDENNRPFNILFVESMPQKAFFSDLQKNQDVMFADILMRADKVLSSYELKHGIQIIDNNFNPIAQQSIPAEMVFDTVSSVPSKSVFTIPHNPAIKSYRVYAELHNHFPGTEPPAETPFPNTLRGINDVEIEPKEALSSDPDKLQVSDLILGYDYEQDDEGSSFLPFVVANNKEIPVNEELVVHYEVYHLRKKSNNTYGFTIEYEILPKNFIGWAQERKSDISLNLNITSEEPTYKQDLLIQTRALEPGNYVLRMTIADDRNQEQQVRREVDFTIVDE